jgi:large repetitive protein
MQFFRNASLRLSAFAPVAVLAAALVVVSGCTSSPSEPSSGPVVTPKPPEQGVSFTVSVTADPAELTAGSTTPSIITVAVRRTDTGQPPADGSQVTVTTTLGAFGSATGPQQVTLQLTNGSAQAFLFAGAESGVATVRAQFTSGGATSSGAANVRIGQTATFFVSSVQPNVGSSQGGEQVVILGGGFEEPVRVTFNGAAATVRSVSPNRIVVITPSAAAAGVPVGVGETQTVDVQVTINVNETNQRQDTITRGFTYAAGGGGISQPQVFSISPASGTNDGGTRVTIVGAGFQAPVQVFFGQGTSATSFNGIEATVESVEPGRIVAITPAARGFGQNLTNQVVDILVKNVNSGFSTVSTDQFKYGTNVQVTSMEQVATTSAGGTRVVIHGSGFDEPVAVSFHFTNPNVSVAQSVISVTGTEIVIRTSPAPLPATCPANGVVSSDSVRVVNIETGDSDDADIGFDFSLPVPQITSINPNSGGTGTSITINGRNFGPNVEVSFGGATGSSAVVTSTSANSVGVIVPNPPSGFTFNTVACGNNGTMNVPTPIDVVVRDLSSQCSATFRGGFLLSPADTTCRNQTPVTPPVAAFDSAVLNAATHTMQFIDKSTGSPTSWSWDFGDGSPLSTTQNPSHTYPAAGNFTVKLTVSNAAGSNQTVKVIAVP